MQTRRALGALGPSLSLTLLLSACGGGHATSAPAEAPKPATATAPEPPRAPITKLRRTDVREAIHWPGVFLQNITVADEPVRRDGKFHGFKIVAVRADWPGLDIAPGDVVTGVNGMPIEHPEEAFDALKSLDRASELRVTYERDGKARELKLPIVDE